MSPTNTERVSLAARVFRDLCVLVIMVSFCAILGVTTDRIGLGLKQRKVDVLTGKAEGEAATDQVSLTLTLPAEGTQRSALTPEIVAAYYDEDGVKVSGRNGGKNQVFNVPSADATLNGTKIPVVCAMCKVRSSNQIVAQMRELQSKAEHVLVLEDSR